MKMIKRLVLICLDLLNCKPTNYIPVQPWHKEIRYLYEPWLKAIEIQIFSECNRTFCENAYDLPLSILAPFDSGSKLFSISNL